MDIATVSAVLALVVPAAAGGVPSSENTAGESIYHGPGTVALAPQTCLGFHGDDGSFYLFHGGDGFWPGDRVFIVGTIVPESMICFPLVGEALEDTTLRPVFEGVGTLVPGPQGCPRLDAGALGMFFIENAGGFMLGDRVYVVGAIEENSTLCWPWIGPGIELNMIHQYFEGCGILHFGPQNCMLLAADSGESLALGNLGGFFIGDRVAVTGIINPESQLCFPFITPGIDENTIEECGPWGDINGDGLVDVADLLLLLGAWGPCPLPPPPCAADLNFDGVVNVTDLLIVLGNWS